MTQVAANQSSQNSIVKNEKIPLVIHSLVLSDLIRRALVSPHFLLQPKGKLIRIGKLSHVTM